MPKTTNPTWYERVPKVELHLHLEGAIPLEALWELVQKYGTGPFRDRHCSPKAEISIQGFPSLH